MYLPPYQVYIFMRKAGTWYGPDAEGTLIATVRGLKLHLREGLVLLVQYMGRIS